MQDSQKRAATAAAAAVSAQGGPGAAIVTETRRFAGKDIQVCLCTCHHLAWSLCARFDRGGTTYRLSNNVYSWGILMTFACCRSTRGLRLSMTRATSLQKSKRVAWMPCWALCNRQRRSMYWTNRAWIGEILSRAMSRCAVTSPHCCMLALPAPTVCLLVTIQQIQYSPAKWCKFHLMLALLKCVCLSCFVGVRSFCSSHVARMATIEGCVAELWVLIYRSMRSWKGIRRAATSTWTKLTSSSEQNCGSTSRKEISAYLET